MKYHREAESTLLRARFLRLKVYIVYLSIISFVLCVSCTWLYVRSIVSLTYHAFVGGVGDAAAPAWSRRAWIYAKAREKVENGSVDLIVNSGSRFYHNVESRILVCYYTLTGKPDAWSLPPAQLDSQICSHIIVGFASVVDCTLTLNDWKVYREIVELKKRQANLKVMISASSNNLDEGFPEMVKNHANRKKFIRSVLNVTKTLSLDGLDVDWEFPSWLGYDEMQRIHFVQLIQELRKEFDRSGRRLILSIAVAAPSVIVDQSYNIPEIAGHVDFVNLMSYDFHSYIWYYPVTGFNAPLFPRSEESGYLATLNVNFSAEYWVAKGMPREKIIVGIPTYGHSYKLDNPLNHGLQAPARGFGEVGSEGFVAYSEICEFLKAGAVRKFDNKSEVPYAYKDYEWISYEDENSVYSKAKWIKSSGFGGAMILSLNVDDWKYACDKNETFPLTRIIAKTIRN